MALRERRGWNQEQLAEHLGVAVSTVARTERGESTPQTWRRQKWATTLGVSLDKLDELLAEDTPAAGRPRGLPPGLVATEWTPASAELLTSTIGEAAADPIAGDVAARLVHEWLVAEPPQQLALRAGRRIGETTVVDAARRVERLRRLDDYLSGPDIEQAVERELVATTELVREGSYSDELGRQLLVVLGDLCQLAGRTAADVGQDQAAAHYFATGTAAAHAAGDRDLAAECVSTLAYHLATTGRRADDAVLLAQSAIAGSRDASSATSRALYLDRLAWTHARAGDRLQTERALGRAEDTFGGRQVDDDPEWVYWLTAVELGLPDQARPRLEGALQTGYDDRPRELALYLSWLAEAELQTGDVAHAAELAARVLELSGHTASTRVDGRAAHLRRLLRPHRGQPAVDAFEDRYQAARSRS